MHGVCTTTGSCCFTRYFSSRDNEGVICFGNKICVSIVIIMTMTDKDILAFNIFFFKINIVDKLRELVINTFN